MEVLLIFIVQAKTLGAAPTTNAHLGWTIQPTLTSVNTATSSIPGTITTISSFTVPQGIWIYEAIVYLSNYPTGFIEWYITNIQSTMDNQRMCGALTTTSGITSRSTGTINNASSSTWYLTAKCDNEANKSILTLKIYLTRIAQTLGAAPTTSAHLGCKITNTASSVSISYNASTNLTNTGVLPSGIWLVTGCVTINVNAGTNFYAWLSNTSNTYSGTAPQSIIFVETTADYGMIVTGIFTSGTVYLTVQLNGAQSSTSMSGNINAVRIGQTLGAAPTSFSGNTGAGSAPLMLGSVVSGTFSASGNFTPGIGKVHSVLTITQPGVYIFSYNVIATATSATFVTMAAWVDDAFTGSNINYLGYQQIPYTSAAGVTSTCAISSSQIYTATASTTFTLIVQFNFISSGTIATKSSQFSFRFVRIA